MEGGLQLNLQLKYSKSNDTKLELFLMIEYLDGKELPFFDEITTLEGVWTTVSRMINLPEAKRVKNIGLSVINADQASKPDGILTIGRLMASVSQELKMVHNQTILFSISSKVFDETTDRYAFVISWIPTNARFYEVFVNDAWVGTSFTSKYCISLSPRHMEKTTNVRLLAYGMEGEAIAHLVGKF